MHMKNIFKSILALTVFAFAATSCDVSNVGNKLSPEDSTAPAASFVQKVISETALNPAITSYEISVGRTSSNAPATVVVESTFADGVCPSAVEFAAGQSESKLVLDISDLAIGTLLKGTITLKDQAGFANSKISVSLQKAFKWEPYGTVTITDDLVAAVFTVENVSWEVEAEKAEGLEVYRLLDPYGENYPYNDPGDFTPGAKLVVDCTDPNAVTFERTNLGFNWGYGEFNAWVLKPGKIVNKVITFPVDGIAFNLPDYGTFTANADGLFSIDLNL